MFIDVGFHRNLTYLSILSSSFRGYIFGHLLIIILLFETFHAKSKIYWFNRESVRLCVCMSVLGGILRPFLGIF